MKTMSSEDGHDIYALKHVGVNLLANNTPSSDWPAHMEESGMALRKTLQDYFPTSRLAIVVTMASDKDK